MPEKQSGTPLNTLYTSSNLLNSLKEAQNRFGYLSEKHLDNIAESLGISKSDIYGVATFYSFLYINNRARHIIRVCKSLPCFIKKSHRIVKAIEDLTGSKLNEPTQNARFSIQLTNCIGECDKAPAMMVDGRVYTDLTPGKIVQVLKEYE
jgi:NADH-quinone oxidoreductase subunit E